MSELLPPPPRFPTQEDPRELSKWRQALYRMFSMVGSHAAVAPGAISAGAIATFTITVPGAQPDSNMAVQVAAPSALEAGLLYSAVITAENTVTVRLFNSTGGGITPASATWAARVLP